MTIDLMINGIEYKILQEDNRIIARKNKVSKEDFDQYSDKIIKYVEKNVNKLLSKNGYYKGSFRNKTRILEDTYFEKNSNGKTEIYSDSLYDTYSIVLLIYDIYDIEKLFIPVPKTYKEMMKQLKIEHEKIIKHGWKNEKRKNHKHLTN